LALHPVPIADIVKYGVIFILWIGLIEFMTFKLGLLETGQWKVFSVFHIVLRALTICILAPLTEEIFFRGLLYTQLNKKFGWKAALFLPAILFTIFHLNGGKGWENIFVIIVFIDAVFYAFIRHKTNSIYITILLHALGNSIAVIERLW